MNNEWFDTRNNNNNNIIKVFRNKFSKKIKNIESKFIIINWFKNKVRIQMHGSVRTRMSSRIICQITFVFVNTKLRLIVTTITSRNNVI